MKIYFSGSISGGRADQTLYADIIKLLKKYGQVLDEHVGEIAPAEWDEADDIIHQRDIEWIKEADVIIAEVTQTSLGVGYEIGRAVALEKPTAILFRSTPTKRLSPMIAGCPDLSIYHYSKLEELDEILKQFFQELATTN